MNEHHLQILKKSDKTGCFSRTMIPKTCIKTSFRKDKSLLTINSGFWILKLLSVLSLCGIKKLKLNL